MVPIWIERGAFKLPEMDVPLICVGPGTGVAPLRSFLHHRAALAAAGQAIVPSVLISGCRHRCNDWLYQSEWSDLVGKGVLHSKHGVNWAFSRDQDKKVYVQDLIRRLSGCLWPLLFESRAVVFVSGSANKMPTAVAEAFESVIADGMACDLTAAHALRVQLEKGSRYSVEAWS
jgi:NADPH-ferrihemoprotein reductase